jgi:hypothetical protein
MVMHLHTDGLFHAIPKLTREMEQAMIEIQRCQWQTPMAN